MTEELPAEQTWADAVAEWRDLHEEVNAIIGVARMNPTLLDDAAVLCDKSALVLESVRVPESEELFRRVCVDEERELARIIRADRAVVAGNYGEDAFDRLIERIERSDLRVLRAAHADKSIPR